MPIDRSSFRLAERVLRAASKGRTPRYAGRMMVDFTSSVFRWDARSEAWFFVALPAELSEEIREIPRISRGFGSVRVVAMIGRSTWRTSIFPDADRRAYVLPLKRAVRDAEGISDGATITVALEVLDG